MNDDPVVEIVRTIEAPREQVFRAWTDPDELRRSWGPGECRPVDEVFAFLAEGENDRRWRDGVLDIPMVARTMRSEVAQLDRFRGVLENRHA